MVLLKSLLFVPLETYHTCIVILFTSYLDLSLSDLLLQSYNTSPLVLTCNIFHSLQLVLIDFNPSPHRALRALPSSFRVSSHLGPSLYQHCHFSTYSSTGNSCQGQVQSTHKFIILSRSHLQPQHWLGWFLSVDHYPLQWQYKLSFSSTTYKHNLNNSKLF